MRKIIDDDDISRELNVADLISEFQADILWMDDEDIDQTEWDLITSQYAYVKFGLILEKIRSRSWWLKCAEKFSDFRTFCQAKVNLNIWQVANAIKSANVAVRLAFLGFTELPRNASQALKMADLSIERLGEVWGNVVKSCQGHKITALAIEQQINPDKQVTSSTVRLPASVHDGLVRQAIEHGLTLQEYLKRLANGEQLDECHKGSDPIDSDPEMTEVLDNLDLKFKSIELDRVSNTRASALDVAPIKIIDAFDRLMDGLIGQFIPPVRRT